jgi:hypothetical protein
VRTGNALGHLVGRTDLDILESKPEGLAPPAIRRLICHRLTFRKDAYRHFLSEKNPDSTNHTRVESETRVTYSRSRLAQLGQHLGLGTERLGLVHIPTFTVLIGSHSVQPPAIVSRPTVLNFFAIGRLTSLLAYEMLPLTRDVPIREF